MTYRVRRVLSGGQQKIVKFSNIVIGLLIIYCVYVHIMTLLCRVGSVGAGGEI